VRPGGRRGRVQLGEDGNGQPVDGDSVVDQEGRPGTQPPLRQTQPEPVYYDSGRAMLRPATEIEIKLVFLSSPPVDIVSTFTKVALACDRRSCS
jgi:hypothetical protein